MNLETLNNSQRKAVTFENKHLLVLAGAGTGKTKTIVARAAYLISQGTMPDKIQILTFTKRAASEIVSRVKNNLNDNEASNLNGSTFHSWCNQLISNFPNLFGTNSFTVIDQDDQLSIMKLVCGKNHFQFENIRIKAQTLIDIYSFGRNTKRNLTETIKAKLSLDSSNCEEDIKKIKPHLEVIFRGYQQKKMERKYLDYDDLLLVVANRLQKDEKARELISSHYEHILVDEMQDTNPLQWDLLSPFQDICHLFCVGDDAQSIYSFRGADFKNVHAFKERVKKSEVYILEENYRSTQEILDLSNWLLGKSPIKYEKRLKSVRGLGLTPKILNVENNWDEAIYIANEIIENFTKRNKNYKNHLVLSRSQYYTKALQAIFLKNKIPYVTYGGRKFMESAHIKDLISALRVVNNIKDEIAWIRFLTFWEGIGAITATKHILNILDLNTIEECIEYLSKANFKNNNQKITQALKQINDNKYNVGKAVEEAYENMEERLIKKYKENWENKRKPDFPVLKVLGKTYATLGEFITESILDNSTQAQDSPTLKGTSLSKTEKKDCVIISTIHSAKGLEADICFVLNVTPSAFPLSRTLGDIDAIEEERRILYVALTRAKNELILTRNVHSVYAEDPDHPNFHEHYFLNGLPQELAEQVTIERQNNKVKDIDKPNILDLSIGMDFN